MEKHVTALFLAWQEKSLPDAEREQVSRHLERCPECSNYFRAMTFALDEARPAPSPALEPDPFLPARIRARMSEHGHRPGLVPVLRFSGASLTLIVAIAIGIYLGKGLVPQTQQASTTDLFSSYYSTLTQENFASSSWDSALSDGQEDEK